MSETIQDTLFLQQRETKANDQFTREVGPKICQFLSRIIRVSQMFDVEHNQTTIAAREFATWIEEQLNEFKEESLQVQMTLSNFFLNGQLVRLDARSYAATVAVRTTFLGFSVNQVTFNRGVATEEILALVEALKHAKDGLLTLETFSQPHLELAAVEEKELDAPEIEDKRRELIEVYAGLLVKCSVYFHRLRRGGNPSSKHVKRLVQRICDEVRNDNGDVFIGLINLRLVVGQDFCHAVNTSIYAMMLGHTVGLQPTDLVRCAITALTQDIERIHEAEVVNTGFQTGDETHFNTNLTSVISVSSFGSVDVLSALRLVTTYERGFPFNKPLPQAWYREELRPHLLSRIVEISRHYDLLTQGAEGTTHTPDIALQKMMMKMGSYYDTQLLKLFVNIVGIYPVGCVVELSTGERALVMRSPSVLTDNRISSAHRPVVRLLTSDRIVDLSTPSNAGIRIIRIVEESQLEERPGAFFLF